MVFCARTCTGILLLCGAASLGVSCAAQAARASFGCEVQPVSVYPGDRIVVTGRVINVKRRKKVAPTYTWETNGGTITGNGDGATISTSRTAPGDYILHGRVQGSGPQQQAECTASFRVMAFEPPALTCTADPATITSGGFSTITAIGRSAQSRSLSFSFSPSGGQISANGNTARLAASDVGPGSVRVRCNVMDDRGALASSVATIRVVAPPPAPAPQAQNLCSISFKRDRKRPVRVDNEAKACLDDIALELNRESDAVLVLVGKHDSGEKPDAAAERTLNVKQYMTVEKGMAAGRIQLRIGENTGRMVDNFLVPPGARLDPAVVEV